MSIRDRNGDYQQIAAIDYLQLLREVKDQEGFVHQVYAASRFENLKEEYSQTAADLMVVISWNTDNTDIDLHILEPTGEECYYQNAQTKIGGSLTKDVTQGYGPEMYLLEKAPNGSYQIKVKYFAHDANRKTTRTKVYATVYKHWGKGNEEVETKVVSLASNKEMHPILTLNMD